MEGLIQDIARRRAWPLPGRSKLRMVWRSIVRCFQLMVKSCDSEGLEEGGPSRVALSSFRRRCDGYPYGGPKRRLKLSHLCSR